MIEGNRLDSDQTKEVVKHEGHFPNQERDERRVKRYYSYTGPPAMQSIVSIIFNRYSGQTGEKLFLSKKHPL
jgi:hypothetical protein